MKKKYTSHLVLVFTFLGFLHQTQGQNKNQIKQIRSNSNLTELHKMYSSFKSQTAKDKQIAIQIAKQKNWKIKFRTKDNRTIELQKVIDGTPIYYTTYNIRAAKSTRTNHLNKGGSLGLNLMGQNMIAHVWDAGIANVNHQEYDGNGGNNRFSVGDTTNKLDYHAEHVTGTIMASGFDPKAKGMAPQSTVIGYDWNNDLSEASLASENGMLLSNHSYGVATRGADNELLLNPEYFGSYNYHAQKWDEIMFNAPHYLMVKSAGNDGLDNEANPFPINQKGGWDKLTGQSTAKNNLVVANAYDANVDSNGNLISVSIDESSSQGPTDDMRIKPDITGNGANIYSSFHFPSWDEEASQHLSDGNINDDYYTIGGTSMAAPNVTGSLLLLQQHYKSLHHDIFMKAATLKGLALHTADDAGPQGPDAVFGWGLLNAKKAAETITQKGKKTKIEELTLTTGQTDTIKVFSDGKSPLLASISWTDIPGDINTSLNSSTPTLVNDLDIRVLDSETTFYPYRLTGPTTSTKKDNKVDPFERIDIPNASGSYTIIISHKGSLMGGSQNYSLIVTGITSSCNATTPNKVSVSSLNDTNAKIQWNSSLGASYDIRYRPIGSNKWITNTETYSSTILNNLTASTTYEVQVRSICSSTNSDFSTTINFTTLDTPIYCEASGKTTDTTEITSVEFGTINNPSKKKKGYEDFTRLNTIVSPNLSYNLAVSVNTGGDHKVYTTAFIDWNQDMDFSDDETYELGFINNNSPNIPLPVKTITVPSNAKSGNTRMRIITKYSEKPTPCDTDFFGEVEDYTLNISTPSLKTIPNPASEFITINLKPNTDNATYTIFDMTGGLIKSTFLKKDQINISFLSTGMYILEVYDGQKTLRTKLIKK